ncbi:MAG TPA: MATE family efflux transporter [Anaerolineales bacterium]|nr:MATE family efflux transporter [Anaerolineales bacterium]
MTAPIEPPSTAKDEIAAEQPEQLTARLKIGTRRPGLSLAAFPALLYSFLPYSLQARLTEGSVTHRVLSLAWPSVMEQSLLTLVGLVDAYIVGHLGAAAIAGVGLGGQVLNLTAALFSAVGVGATALIARHIGADEPDEANRLAGQALVLALAIGCLAALIAFIYAAPIMRLLGAAPEVVVDGAAWLRVVAPSFITVGALLVGTASLRGAGDTRTPLGVMIIVNLVNVAVAWTFTRGLFGLPNLGVVGSGLGAMSGQIIGGLAVVFILIRGRGHLKLGWRLPAPDFARLRRILNIGLPAGAEQVLLQLALLNLAVIISQLGTAAYAAHHIGIRIVSMAFLPGWGFSVAATTLVGQELGARRPDRARRATYASFLLALAVMTSMGLVIFALSEPILRLFTDDADVIREGMIVVRADGLLQPLIAASFVFSGALRGAGDTRATMLITIVSVWALRLTAAYLLAITLGLGLLGVWLGIGVDFASRSTWFWLRFRSGKWTALRV